MTQRLKAFWLAKGVAALAVIGLLCHIIDADLSAGSAHAQDATAKTPAAETAVDLTDSQLGAIKIEPVGTFAFDIEKDAPGNVAYHDQDVGGQETPRGKAHAFIIANVLESDSPSIRVGQNVHAKLLAYPDREFEGTVAAIGVTAYDAGGNPALDPGSHRMGVRCDMADPRNEFYPGMLATVFFQVRKPVEATSLAENGVVREGDGTLMAWVTADRHHFTQRVVKTGLREEGRVQILEGLSPGELAVTDGAIFLDNMLQAPTDD